VDSKVSVIIPTYNRCRLLAETLTSVCRQTWHDHEIIVVDDGSVDGTRRLVAASSDQLVYHHIQHAGASAARNAGLDIAGGEYIAFLDSDDLWKPRFLERMMAALDAAPVAGFVYCDYATFDAHGMVQRAYLPPQHKQRGNLFTQLLETDFISTGALLIRRRCFHRIGRFDPDLEIAHDWDLWLRLAREFDAEYVDEPLACIRIDSDGLTRNTPLLYADNLQVLAKLRQSIDGNRQHRRLIRRNMFAAHRALFSYFLGARHPWRVLKHFTLMLTMRFL